jgi:hypothetical protein
MFQLKFQDGNNIDVCGCGCGDAVSGEAILLKMLRKHTLT